MTITNFSPETQAAIDTLYGSRETDAAATQATSPIARAVAAAAQQLQRTHAGELESKRLTAAMQLVLSHSVTLHLDGSSSVQSGARVYSQRDRACSCPDHQNRQRFCKHLMAVELYPLAQALLGSAPAGEAPEPAAAAVPELPASAAWDVHEAPVSCYLKLRLGGMELSYTMRDTDDHQLATRLRQVLPRLQALEAEDEAQREARRAAKQAETQAAGEAAGGLGKADVQQLVQQAVQQALGQGNGSQPPATPPEPEARDNDDGDQWCSYHEAWMPERSNAQGTWHSHPAADEQGEYYCKGNGRQRRNHR